MKRPSTILLRITILLLLCLGAALFVSPLLVMIVGSLKPDEKVLVEAGSLLAFWPTEPSLQNYRDVFRRADFIRYCWNSLFITGTVVTAGLAINSMAGYAFARLRFKGQKLLFGAVAAIMIIPLEAIAVPLFYQVTLLGWRDTYLVQILPFAANAFSIYLFYTFFLELPREFEESAYIDGAGVFRTFFSIILPNAKPVFATVAILSFLSHWGVFLWPLMVTSGEKVRPLPLGIAMFYTLPPLQWGDIFAFSVMMVLPVLVVFLIFQGWFVRGVAATGIKG